MNKKIAMHPWLKRVLKYAGAGALAYAAVLCATMLLYGWGAWDEDLWLLAVLMFPLHQLAFPWILWFWSVVPPSNEVSVMEWEKWMHLLAVGMANLGLCFGLFAALTGDDLLPDEQRFSNAKLEPASGLDSSMGAEEESPREGL